MATKLSGRFKVNSVNVPFWMWYKLNERDVTGITCHATKL